MTRWHDPTIRRNNSWMPDRTADQRSAALNTLGDAVRVRKHPYDRHPNSGAGNCWCGCPMSHNIHRVRPRHRNIIPAFKSKQLFAEGDDQ